MTEPVLFACPVGLCKGSMDPWQAMCWDHWVLVPSRLQRELYAAFRARQQATRAFRRGQIGRLEFLRPAGRPGSLRFHRADHGGLGADEQDAELGA